MTTLRQYKQYGRKEFEWNVRNFLIENKLGFMKDYTEAYIAEGGTTWEHIYTVSTRNRSVDIIIFSSIDIRSGYVREKSDDAVRVVLRWKTKNGYVYKKLAKHLRIKTLFNNLHKTIAEAQKSVFSLNYKEFYKED